MQQKTNHYEFADVPNVLARLRADLGRPQPVAIPDEYARVKQKAHASIREHTTPFAAVTPLLFAALLESSHAAAVSICDGQPSLTVVDIRATDEKRRPADFGLLLQFVTMCARRTVGTSVVGLTRGDAKLRGSVEKMVKRLQSAVVTALETNVLTIQEALRNLSPDDLAACREHRKAWETANRRVEQGSVGPTSMRVLTDQRDGARRKVDDDTRRIKSKWGFNHLCARLTRQTTEAEQQAMQIARTLDELVARASAPSERAIHLLTAWQALCWSSPRGVCSSPARTVSQNAAAGSTPKTPPLSGPALLTQGTGSTGATSVGAPASRRVPTATSAVAP